MDRLKSIKDSLIQHRNVVNSTVSTVQRMRKSYFARLDENRGNKYSDQYIANQKENWKPNTEFTEAITTSRSKTMANCDYQIGLLKGDLDKFFNADAGQGFTNDILLINASGRKLTASDVNLLNSKAKTYSEKMALKSIVQTHFDGDSMTRESIMRQIDESTPNIETAFRYLSDLEGSCQAAVNYYVGKDYDSTTFGYFKPNDFNENASHEQVISSMAWGDNIINHLDSDSCFMEMQKIVDGMNKTTGKVDYSKLEPTPAEKEMIDCICGDFVKYPVLAMGHAEKVCRASEELTGIFLKDSRYRNHIAEELGIELDA